MGIFQIEPQSGSYSTSQGEEGNMGQDVSPTEQRGCGPGQTVCGLEEVESPQGKHRWRETESSQRGARKVQWGYYGAYGRKWISWALFLAKPVTFKNSIYFEKTFNI